MRATLTLGLALMLVAGALTGCGKKSSSVMSPTGSSPAPGSSVEQASVSATLAATPEVIEDGLAEDSTPLALSASPAGALAAINPITYWRMITHSTREFAFAFADTDSTGRPTTARVTVYKDLTGSFKVLRGFGNPDSLPYDSTGVVTKPLADLWVRHILLKRVRLGTSTETVWRVAGTSGVKVTSFDPKSPASAPVFGDTRILSLRVQGSGVDTTITDPLAFYRLAAIPAFTAGDPITLTATTRADDDVVVLMWRGMRFRFHNNGDGTYSGVWRAVPVKGIAHVGINALAHGTLFDDVAPYSSQEWILPYHVRPGVVADLLP